MMGTSVVARRRFELMAAEYLERIGQRIRERRDELGLSRADVAREMPGKTNENQVYRWERGLHRPHDDALEALARVLKVDSPAYFLAPAPDKTETPDVLQALDGGSQLDRIERMLREAEKERHQVMDLLARQDDVLARIEDLTALLPTDEVARDLLRAIGVNGPPDESSASGEQPTGDATQARRRAAS